jgi:hypothetical protein
MRMNINEQLIRRIENIYEETQIVVKTSQGVAESFTTGKGVRQGCVMSPLLFNLYMEELEEVLRNRGIGGVVLGTVK